MQKMLKYYEFCPKCQGIRSMSVTIALKKVPGPTGVREILVHNYHCDSCSTFVFSQAGTEIQTEGYFEVQPAGPMV